MDDDHAGRRRACVGTRNRKRISRSRFCPEHPASPFLKMPSPPSFSSSCCIIEPVVALNQREVFPTGSHRTDSGFNIEHPCGANSRQASDVNSCVLTFCHHQLHNVAGREAVNALDSACLSSRKAELVSTHDLMLAASFCRDRQRFHSICSNQLATSRNSFDVQFCLIVFAL